VAWQRKAARVVVLDPEDRVLLIRASDPADPAKGRWWEIPGGGMEPGESSAQAATREMIEETGLVPTEVSGPVWRQHVSYVFAGMRFDQDEWIHIARCDGGEYQPSGLEPIEALAFEGAGWHELGDLPRLGSVERILPPWLPQHLPAVVAAGLPDTEIDLGTQPPSL
jgi:8-oxo-dGTP pyrophosphatase MutT (NUDIX family)